MDWPRPKLTSTPKSIPLQVTTNKSFQVTESFQEVQVTSGKSSRVGSMSMPLESKGEEKIEQAANVSELGKWEFSDAYGDYEDIIGPKVPPK